MLYLEQVFRKTIVKEEKVLENTQTMVYEYKIRKLDSYGMKQRYSTNDKILSFLTPIRENSHYFDEMLLRIRNAGKRIIDEDVCNEESISKLNFLEAIHELIEDSQKEDLFLKSTAEDAFRQYIMAHEEEPGMVFEAFARSGY